MIKKFKCCQRASEIIDDPTLIVNWLLPGWTYDLDTHWLKCHSDKTDLIWTKKVSDLSDRNSWIQNLCQLPKRGFLNSAPLPAASPLWNVNSSLKRFENLSRCAKLIVTELRGHSSWRVVWQCEKCMPERFIAIKKRKCSERCRKDFTDTALRNGCSWTRLCSSVVFFWLKLKGTFTTAEQSVSCSINLFLSSLSGFIMSQSSRLSSSRLWAAKNKTLFFAEFY